MVEENLAVHLVAYVLVRSCSNSPSRGANDLVEEQLSGELELLLEVYY